MKAMLRGPLALLYALLCLAVSALSILAVFGFAFPALDLINHFQPILFFGCLVAMFVAPVFLRSLRARAAALAISATGLAASAFIYVPEVVAGFATSHPAPRADAPLYTLVTFNVFARNETPEQIAQTVLAIEPDIVALQEYSSAVRERIHPVLSQQYPHFQFCLGGERAFVGLYAKIPFTPGEDNACSGSAMNPDRTARIIANFVPENAARFTIATTHNDWPAPIWRQSQQLDTLAGALGHTPEPLLLVADFNSTPWSYALRGFVQRAGLTRYTRNVPTFPTLWYYLGDWRRTLPFLPIDHVMGRGGITVHTLETGDPSGSDHLPVIVRFSVDADTTPIAAPPAQITP